MVIMGVHRPMIRCTGPSRANRCSSRPPAASPATTSTHQGAPACGVTAVAATTATSETRITTVTAATAAGERSYQQPDVSRSQAIELLVLAGV